MGNAAIVGINWGDEGKGRMVDLLTQDYDIVVRYQGGGNAGHTVVNEYGKFALHLLPSGIFREGVMNVLGNGVALDPENLWKEIETIKSMAFKVNELLKERFARMNITLVDFKLEFGRLKDGTIVLADEISPDTCRFWDSTTHEKLDKDRFRRDMGGVEEAYAEIMRRLEAHL